MTDDTVTSVDMDNLDNFSNAFFGDEPVKDDPVQQEEETEEEVPENGDDTPATDVDEDATEEEEPQTDETEEEEPEEVPKPKGKKSAKERIEELYADNKTKDRALAEALRQIEALKTPNVEVKTSETKLDTLASDAPKSDAVDDKGEPLYPLGEYDPLFIRDLTRHTIAEERKIAEADAAQKTQENLVRSAQAELTSVWVEKVAAAEEALPDIRERLAGMEPTFASIDPGYGEFLAASIMSCENGPQIMYYLSQNIGEAQKIVASGPQAAILAIGKLDGKFDKPVTSEKRNTKTVSKASEPPVTTTRGNTGKTSVAPDTTDLKAFEREFYKK